MSSLMDMRELGMLRNATQRMESGGGIDMDEWRRRKRKEEESVAEQAIALAQDDPRYQALISGASGGPAAVGSVAKLGGRGLRTLFGGGSKYNPNAFPNNKWWNRARGSGEALPPPTPKDYTGLPLAVGSAIGATAVSNIDSGDRDKNIEARREYEKLREQALQKNILTDKMKENFPDAGEIDDAEFAGRSKWTPEVGRKEYERRERSKELRYSHDRRGTDDPAKSVKEDNKDKNLPEENEINTPNLWKTWGSLADNPKERKKAYLSSIKKIYMKKMLLDGIAQLTGGVSQGDTWAQMAIAELDAMEKFDSEERVHNQWKALFFREDGTYDPPKNRKDAIERGGKLGYTADQMKDVLSVFPKDTSDTAAMKNFKWYNSLKGSQQELVGRLLGITKDNVKQLSPSNLTSLINSDAFAEFETEERQEVMEIIKGLIPGFKGTPTFANKEEAQAAANRGEIKVNDRIIVDGKPGTWN